MSFFCSTILAFTTKFTSTFSHFFALTKFSHIANFTVLDCLFHGSLVSNVIFLHSQFHFFQWLFHFNGLYVNFNFLHCGLFHFYTLPNSLKLTFLYCQFHFCALPILLLHTANFMVLWCQILLFSTSVSLFCTAKLTLYTASFTFLCNSGSLNF